MLLLILKIIDIFKSVIKIYIYINVYIQMKYLYNKECAYLILQKDIDYKNYISHNIPVSVK